MNAAIGDRLVVRGHHTGEPDRAAEILEVRGPDGFPPYLVRWDGDGHVGLFHPGIRCRDRTREEEEEAHRVTLSFEGCKALDEKHRHERLVHAHGHPHVTHYLRHGESWEHLGATHEHEHDHAPVGAPPPAA